MKIDKAKAISFSKYFDLDKELSAIMGTNPAYDYLQNPIVSNIYQYLTDYVAAVSEKVTGKQPKQLSVLDWGAGKGNVTYLLRKFGFGNVVSCDIEGAGDSFGNKTAIIQAYGISIVPLKHEWILPFQDNSFDVVVSYGVLEHVPNDLESLKEIKRVLKPGGLFFCFHLPRKLGYVHFIARRLGDRYHHRLYNRTSCARLLSQTGYKLLDIWERSIFPKNRLKPLVSPHMLEKLDHILVRYTPLGLISTNVEFVAQKE